MTPYDDDSDDMDGSAQLTAFLAELRELGDERAPEPQGRLAELLDGTAPLPSPGMPWRVVRRAALLVAAVAAALFLAAANHTLPAPAQRVVSRVVHELTPFNLSSGPSDSSVAPHTGPPLAPPPSRPSAAPDRSETGDAGADQPPAGSRVAEDSGIGGDQSAGSGAESAGSGDGADGSRGDG